MTSHRFLAATVLAGVMTLPTASAAGSRWIHDPAAGVFAVDQLSVHTGVPRDELSVWRVLSDEKTGKLHVRMARTYKGIPVIGGDTIVHMDASGNMRGVSGHAVALDMDVTPSINVEKASTLALARLGKAGTASGELVIWLDENGEQKRLAWHVVASGTEGVAPFKHDYYIDAKSGAVLQDFDSLETVNGTGRGYHNGNVTITVTKIGAKYYMRDLTTRNFDTAREDTLAIFSSSTRTFGNGSYTNNATNGADAHYGAMMTWDYYEDTFGRNGIDDAGTYTYSLVYTYGSHYVNAYWDSSCFCMTYGDGWPASGYYPLTSLDVAGHEFSHGVSDSSVTGGLRYIGQSGGINEGNSDIFGTMVECYAGNANDPCDWYIGEEVVSGGYLRDMSDPTSDGSSIDHLTDYYAGLDVHYSSGLVNNFFYLLSDGGTNGTSGETVTGIGSDAAAAIWYQALTNYFTSTETFADARTDTLQAADDLYGSGSAEYAAVEDAWHAVGVY